MHRVRQSHNLFRVVPKTLSEEQVGIDAAVVIQTGANDGAEARVERGCEPEPEHESRNIVELKLADDPAKRTSGGFAVCRRFDGELLGEIFGCHVARKEVLLLSPVPRKIERVRSSIDDRRQFARTLLRTKTALVPKPCDLAPKPKRRLSHPVVRELITRSEVRREDNVFELCSLRFHGTSR